MSYTKDMKDITTKYRTAIKGAEEELKKLERDGYKGSRYYTEKAVATEKRIEDLKRQASNELEKRKETFKGELNARYLPKGEELTPDANIFRTDIRLTQDEVTAYMEKYKDNMSMSRLITDYAKKHDLSVNASYVFAFSKEEKLISSERLLSYCKSALTDSMFMSEIIENEANYSKACGVLVDD